MRPTSGSYLAVIGAMKQPVAWCGADPPPMTDDQLRDSVVDSNTDAKMANSAARGCRMPTRAS